MRIIIPIASAMAVVLASGTLTACRDKGPVYNTNHPEQGEIVLTTDWSERGEGIDTPGRYVVRVDGDDADLSTFTTDTNVLPELLGPGKHRLSLWNDVPGIVVRGNTATVETTTVSRTGEPPLGRNDFLDGEVGWFFSTAMDVEIEPDMVHNVTAVMHQRVRELTLVLEPTGGSADGIESITAMVSGWRAR